MVNPYEMGNVARVLDRALKMPKGVIFSACQQLKNFSKENAIIPPPLPDFSFNLIRETIFQFF